MTKLAQYLLLAVSALLLASTATQFIANTANQDDLVAQVLIGAKAQSSVAQVQELKPGSVTTVTPTASAFQFDNPLSLGVNNQDVLFLQKFLNTNGFLVAKSSSGSPGNETTYFGNATKAALMAYQASKKLAITGSTDSATIESINTSTNPCSPILLSNSSSDANPTLPPVLNPAGPIGTNPGEFNCKDWSWNFCQGYEKLNPGASCSGLIFDHHNINFIRYKDENGKEWVCLVEPQTNDTECMPAEKWDQLHNWRDWVINFCQNYPIPQTVHGCRDVVPTIFPEGQQCSALIGKSCDGNGAGSGIVCSTSDSNGPNSANPTLGQLLCTCENLGHDLGYSCTWKKPDMLLP